MNTYSKYCPNVFAAKCTEQHEEGEEITLTTKYGKEHECTIHNYLGRTTEGMHLYSITRSDGYNAQERAQNKVDKLNGYAFNAEKRSTEAWKASHEGREFLSLGEPIKIGHHSERRHRALIQRNWARMGKSVAEAEKAKDYINRAEYWEKKTSEINLSMPESLAFFEFKLEQAKNQHQELKDNPEKRRHSMSLQYSNKAVKDTEKNLQIAVKLWGTKEEIDQIDKEKKELAKAKVSKTKKKEDIVKKHGGFFAFNDSQFKDGVDKIRESGHLEQDEKVRHIFHGLYLPSKNVDTFLKEYK
jgi:hypothetical protein